MIYKCRRCGCNFTLKEKEKNRFGWSRYCPDCLDEIDMEVEETDHLEMFESDKKC